MTRKEISLRGIAITFWLFTLPFVTVLSRQLVEMSRKLPKRKIVLVTSQSPESGELYARLLKCACFVRSRSCKPDTLSTSTDSVFKQFIINSSHALWVRFLQDIQKLHPFQNVQSLSFAHLRGLIFKEMFTADINL